MDKQKGQEEYVNLRIKLAEDKIKVARLLFNNNEYRDAVSRAYYAVFYAAKAFLLNQGHDPSTHKGVDTLFHKFCFDRGTPSIDSAKIFSLMRHARLEADYKEKITITKKDARESIEMAASFLKEIKNLVNKNKP